MIEADSIVQAVSKHANESPEKTALAAGDESVTYAELWKNTNQVAAVIAEASEPGKPILLSSVPGQVSFVSAYLGAHLARQPVVPVDHNSPMMALRKLAVQADACLAILSKTQTELGIPCLTLSDLENTRASTHQFDLPKSASIADILFTSGTTGEPKGVALSHESVLAAARNINEFVGTQREDVEVLPLPLTHSFGLGRVRCCLLAGASLVLTPGFTFPGMVSSAMEKWTATGFASVPAGIAVLLNSDSTSFEKYRTHLRYIEIGSAPMSLAHKQLLMKSLPQTRICMHYGLTEASRSAFIEFHESRDYLASVGRAAPNVGIKVVDEAGQACPPLAKGELLVTGGHIMNGYCNNLEATGKTLVDGWIRTGDIGYLDEEGHLFLEGRGSELINVGGKKVSPLEVERLLHEVPGVKECAVVAIEDDKGVTGQAVLATLVAEPNINPPAISFLKSYLRNHLEPYKLPTRWEWVESLPRTESGKIKRLDIRKSISQRT